jgi:hypothetical protein
MAPVGIEPTIPVFERAKAFHDLDHATTVMGQGLNYNILKDTFSLHKIQ